MAQRAANAPRASDPGGTGRVICSRPHARSVGSGTRYREAMQPLPLPLIDTRSGDREPVTVALAGDWHANTPYARRAIEHARAGGADAIVHLGDFGYLFDAEYLEALDAALGDMPLYFIDGNHERFPWLLERPTDARGVRPVSARIAHLPRGYRWTWRGRSWLALGGAHSVDRQFRTPDVEWWSEETVTPDDVRRAIEPGAVDVLVCHDAPAGIPVPHTYPDGTFPLEDERIGEAHRDTVRAVVDGTHPRLIAHGHFHQHYRSTLGTAAVIGLAHDHHDPEFNVAFIDTASLALVPPTTEAPVILNPTAPDETGAGHV